MRNLPSQHEGAAELEQAQAPHSHQDRSPEAGGHQYRVLGATELRRAVLSTNEPGVPRLNLPANPFSSRSAFSLDESQPSERSSALAAGPPEPLASLAHSPQFATPDLNAAPSTTLSTATTAADVTSAFNDPAGTLPDIQALDLDGFAIPPIGQTRDLAELAAPVGQTFTDAPTSTAAAPVFEPTSPPATPMGQQASHVPVGGMYPGVSTPVAETAQTPTPWFHGAEAPAAPAPAAAAGPWADVPAVGGPPPTMPPVAHVQPNPVAVTASADPQLHFGSSGNGVGTTAQANVPTAAMGLPSAPAMAPAMAPAPSATPIAAPVVAPVVAPPSAPAYPALNVFETQAVQMGAIAMPTMPASMLEGAPPVTPAMGIPTLDELDAVTPRRAKKEGGRLKRTLTIGFLAVGLPGTLGAGIAYLATQVL